tara:strand:- start:405 stop:575 length:171 start_codon:yes stop_codon:yes gene_type:complete
MIFTTKGLNIETGADTIANTIVPINNHLYGLASLMTLANNLKSSLTFGGVSDIDAR